MGSGSLKGCNVCDFGGVHFGETVKYPSYARYTIPTDSRRLRRPTGCANSNVMWNIDNITSPQPRNRTYDEYIAQGSEVESGLEEANVNGVHAPWILHQLSYAYLIHPTKDAMHCAHNTIRDSIKLFKPNQSNPFFVNRTKRPAVIASCRLQSIFSFLSREINPTWPWILPKESCQTHDNRLSHVLGLKII
jgi:hypothetical protein